MFNSRVLLFLISLSLLLEVKAESGAPSTKALDGERWEAWSGVQPGADGATLSLPGEAVWRHPDGSRGSYKHGFRVLNDGTADWHELYGLRLELRLEGEESMELYAAIFPAQRQPDKPGHQAKVMVRGPGWHTVTLPWSAFDEPAARRDWLLAVKELRIGARFEGGEKGAIAIRNVRAVGGAVVSLASSVRGKSVKAGGSVDYAVTVENVAPLPQAVKLSFTTYGWEAMTAAITPSTFSLDPGEVKSCTVRVQVPAQIPPGGHEQQTLQAIANGEAEAASTLTFITASELPHPNILHTRAGWNEVREKVKKYSWAKAAQDDFVQRAEKWQVPEVTPPSKNDPDDTMGAFVFPTTTENDVMAAGFAWQLTGNKTYANKVAEFLRRLSNPESGYPKTLRACNQSLVQEGHYFQHMAMAYDMILDAGTLSQADRTQIEETFRLLIETMNRANLGGSINNWNVSENVGALFCSLALQDLTAADRFYRGPGGVVDQLAKGTMDDGWWYECSISYNTWVASEFSQVALALEPWGINFKEAHPPANYSPNALLTTDLSGGKVAAIGSEQLPNRPFGMTPEIWGPNTRSYRSITQLWDSLLPFLDYRGVMFGVNDSTENLVVSGRREVGGQPFELAYSLFRDPAYAAIVKLGNQRDLLYAVPDLLEKTPERFRDSAYSDNVGLAMLRSQTADRPIREQIQAVLHYGTHGWAHGHFDRTNLLHLSRYGRSFYNPEMIWYSYEPFMYKFYVQTSESHNMVVVDRKMQEATPGQRFLFHTGKMMQVSGVETTARWSNPPYGGMVYDYVPVKTFAEKTWREGRFVPIPANAPAYGTLTNYSEPILQRRLMIVTDDYVVLADYLKGSQPHRFESLLQMKGFKGLEATGKKLLRHDAQWDPDPVKSAQFVTDCDWYAAEAPSTSHFEMQFGPGADNEGTRALYSEEGVLKLDVHDLWPRKQEIMVGTAPEDHAVEKRLFYAVRGNGKILAEGKFGAWILGRDEIDVSVEGFKELELETRVELSKKPTVFWANARMVLSDGHEVPLREMTTSFDNVEQPKQAGADYFGGPIKIAGERFDQATPGQPKDTTKPAFVRIDLTKAKAVRFKATIGGDYPLGDEAARRKTYLSASDGSEARFLTIIEPFEETALVKSASASGPDTFLVELNDGRVQEIVLQNLEGDAKEVAVSIRESKDGHLQREESTIQR